jgi:hypothetical protein
VTPSSLNIKKYHGISEENKIFLHIGALGVFKGSGEIIDALKLVFKDSFVDVNILFVGRMSADLVVRIQNFNSVNLKNNIIVRNEFISEEDFSAYLNQSDVVLIANKNVEASSGILNHSLVRKKIIIAPELGFYKTMLKDYFGACMYNQNFPLEKAIMKARQITSSNEMKNDFDEVAFYKLNSPEEFFKRLSL